MQYTYNKNTRILHIKGYRTNSHSPDYLTFTSEEKAYTYGAGSENVQMVSKEAGYAVRTD